MKNIKILQKLRTYIKNEGMVDFFISEELNTNSILKNEIKKIESYPTNDLKNRPSRFVYFRFLNFYILLQSKYLKPADKDSRTGNFITHSLILEKKIDGFNPIDYFESSCFKLDYELVTKKILPKKDLSLFDLIHSISTPDNNIVFSDSNKKLLIGIITADQENKNLITISNNINLILKELMQLLPPNIRVKITFSNLEFSKISEKKYILYNYSDYSLNLNEMNSYENFDEIMKDANKNNYLCFNYVDNIFPSLETKRSIYVDFVFNNSSDMGAFYNFSEKYDYSLGELDLATLLYEYEVNGINLGVEELEKIIIFVKKQNNEELLQKLFSLIYNNKDFNPNFKFFVDFLEISSKLFSKKKFTEILYSGIEKSLYDETYNIDTLFIKLFTTYSNDRELKSLHSNFIDSISLKRNPKKLLKNILPFNSHTFSLLSYELKNNYFEFIANTDKNTLMRLIEFYKDKRFFKSFVLLKYTKQDIQEYLFSLIEDDKLNISDLARYEMYKEIKNYFEYKRNQIFSKNFFKKIMPFQKNELSLLKEFDKRLGRSDVLSSLIKIVIFGNKSNFPILVELYKSYTYYNLENKKLIFQNINTILKKDFLKYYKKIDFLDELYSDIKPYPYLSAGQFIHFINKKKFFDFKNFELEENIIPLNIIEEHKLDKKILTRVQKKYDRTLKENEGRKLTFNDLLKIKIYI